MSHHWSLSRPLVFICFQGALKGTSDMKWVNVDYPTETQKQLSRAVVIKKVF